MGKKSKAKSLESKSFQKKCIVHTWDYHNVDGMRMRFRVCRKCDALEAKLLIPRPGAKWAQYLPSGGIGFINALRLQIEKKSELHGQNAIPLETIEIGGDDMCGDKAPETDK